MPAGLQWKIAVNAGLLLMRKEQHMKCFLPVMLAMFIAAPAMAEPMKSQIFEGYQRPPKQPPAVGYVTEDGKRYGTCRNHHHRPHKHCKERVPLAKAKTAPPKPIVEEMPADAKVVRVPK
jgi:hypothetical protein